MGLLGTLRRLVIADSSTAIPALMECCKPQGIGVESVEPYLPSYDDVLVKLIKEPVRLISWLLPETYATSLLQNIMLRGLAPDTVLLGGLIVFGLILFVVNLILLNRNMARA